MTAAHFNIPPPTKPRFGRHEQLAATGTGDYPTYVLTESDGGQYTFNTFNPTNSEAQRGAFSQYTGPGGIETVATYEEGQLITIAQGPHRSNYHYYEDGPNKGLLHTVSWRSTQDETLRTATYTYYSDVGDEGSYGWPGDLKSVNVTDSDGNVVNGAYYRYDIATNFNYGSGHRH